MVGPWYRLVLFALLLLLSGSASAAEPRDELLDSETARTLTLGNRPVVVFMADIGAMTPEYRAARARERIRHLEPDDVLQPVTASRIVVADNPAILLSINNKPLFALVGKDLDPTENLTLDEAGRRTQVRLERIRQDYLEQRRPEQLVRGGVLSLLATAFLGGFLFVIRHLHTAWLRRCLRKPLGRLLLPTAPFWLGDLMRRIEAGLAGLLAMVLSVTAGYLWLGFVLTRFPYTRSWGEQLGGSVISLLTRFSDGVIGAMPGLFAVLVIILLARFVIRLLDWLFDAVQRGRLELPGLHRETVGATRRLTTIAISVFALVVAYPYLPGADSEAFKGVSVFLGLMVTLGSAGLVNQAMSGLVLVYSRALKPGDFVHLSDVEGTVTEVGPLSTKLITRNDHEVTLPNSVIVGGKITNLSRHVSDDGLALTTRITIGYDAPWRQVHAMLALAAARTVGVNTRIEPLIRQLALQDFYVEYELQVRIADGMAPPDIRAALHAAIQDVFNEYGVQIMSPHFMSQPDTVVKVGEEHRFDPPAVK